jgi:RND family efflux transporter MFP subunit
MQGDKAQLLRSLKIDRTEEADRPQAPSQDAAPARASRGRSPTPWIAGVAVALAAVGLGVWLLMPSVPAPREAAAPQPQAQTQAQPQPQAQAPAAAPRRGGLIASGYVVARRKATVAAEITGKVVETRVEEGMVVEAGQIIARLDSVLAEKDLALAQSRAKAAEAAVSATAADLAEAERVLERVKTLSQRNFASEAERTRAESRVAMLTAQVSQHQAQLTTARLDAQRSAAMLDKHSIRAPFSGIVIERSAQIGEMISPMSSGGFTRTGICTIVDMDSIEVEVDVNEAYIGRVQAGTKVDAVLGAYPDWTIPGSVIAIVPTANREKATVRVRIAFAQKDPRILPDMAVKVTFLEERPRSNGVSAAQ